MDSPRYTLPPNDESTATVVEIVTANTPNIIAVVIFLIAIEVGTQAQMASTEASSVPIEQPHPKEDYPVYRL